MNEKSLRIRYNNSKLQILDNEVPGGKVTIDDAKGYVPSKNHTFFKLYDPDEKATVYSIEDITQNEDSENRLQMLVTIKDGEKPVVSLHQHKLKKHPCGEKGAKGSEHTREYGSRKNGSTEIDSSYYRAATEKVRYQGR